MTVQQLTLPLRLVQRLSWLVVLCFGVLGCAQRSPAGPSSPPPEVERGQALYERYCALCHGKKGEGAVADNATALAGQELLRTSTDAFLLTAIAQGRPGTPMSAWGTSFHGPLSDSDMASLVAYIRSWQFGPSVAIGIAPISGSVERAAPLYAERCAGCHGDRGQGGHAPTLDNPVFHGTVSDGFIRYAIEHGRSGTKMPAFSSDLKPTELDDLVLFVRSLKKAAAAPVERAPVKANVPAVINPNGPTPKFSLRENFFVPADEVKAALDAGQRLVIADARASSDYLEAHLPGAISLPFYVVDQAVPQLPKDGTYIVAYCACPHAASSQVANALRERGFANAVVLDEGFLVWRERGYPLEPTK